LNPRDNGVGLVAGWRGATTDSYGTPSLVQPRIGHPFPGLGWYSKEVGRLQRLNLYRNLAPTYETRLAEHPTFVLSLDIAYRFKFRVRPIDATTAEYAIKVWEVGTSEPAQFQLVATSARRSGSLLLGAHRADVTFGNLSVTSLSGGSASTFAADESTTSTTTSTTSTTTSTTTAPTTTTSTTTSSTTTSTTTPSMTTTSAAP
jgi:hypothetical protein